MLNLMRLKSKKFTLFLSESGFSGFEDFQDKSLIILGFRRFTEINIPKIAA
jgi:hypothetical protein